MDGAFTELELLAQTYVVVAIANAVERSVVIVVERTQDSRRVTIKHVIEAGRQLSSPQHALPNVAVVLYSGDLAHGRLAILCILRVASVRFDLRLGELVTQLHIERCVIRDAMVQGEVWIRNRATKDLVAQDKGGIVFEV